MMKPNIPSDCKFLLHCHNNFKKFGFRGLAYAEQLQKEGKLTKTAYV